MPLLNLDVSVKVDGLTLLECNDSLLKRSDLAADESTLRIASLALTAIIHGVYTLDLYIVQRLDGLLDLDLVGIRRDTEDVAFRAVVFSVITGLMIIPMIRFSY